MFRDPNQLLTRPLTQSALYLENRRVQYIHALCFAGAGAEYDTLQGRRAITAVDLDISSRITWPEGFLDLCRKERLGEIPVDLQSMKVDGGDNPWHTYPLRDVGSQFQVEMLTRDLERLGSLSYAQLMREAYPGAVYYYLTRPYRVTRVLLQEKKVVVRHEKQYTTDPSSPPPIVAPSLKGEGLHGAYRFSDLSVVECDLWVKEAVFGFTERKGSQAVVSRLGFSVGDRYLVLFDQTYGSLRLTGRLLDEEILRAALGAAAAIAQEKRLEETGPVNGATLEAFDVLLAAARADRQPMTIPPTPAALLRLTSPAASPASSLASSPASDRATVIMPGSIATDNNQEFEVEGVFLHPRDGLRYKGRRAGEDPSSGITTYYPVDAVRPVPGVSQMGEYDLETWELRPVAEPQGVVA